MALKLELKPNERVILGDCVITNHGARTRLLIEGMTPILREKDIMTLASANSPARRLYLTVQQMYTSKRPQDHRTAYQRLTREILQSVPDAQPFIVSINN